MVEKQARIDVIRQVHDELEATLTHLDLVLTTGKMFMLLGSALPLPPLEENSVRCNFQRLARGSDHQIEPVGMLTEVAFVRTLVLGNVQMVFIAINNQRDLWDIPFVDSSKLYLA